MSKATTLHFTGDTRVVGFALGVVVGVPAIIAAVVSGGAGHGGYGGGRGLFPAPIVVTLVPRRSGRGYSSAVALLQFPIYGAIVGWSIAHKSWVPPVMILVAHMIAASVCFAGMLPNFS